MSSTVPIPDSATAAPWWRSAVIYQIYPRSFADANGDGMGDLNGVREHLDYLADLGIDAIWLSPFYPSPQADAGYDVSDYRAVDPIFGTLADAVAMIDEAHKRNLRVIIDIVPNHTSDQHVWFQQALAAAPGSRERARYLFRDGRGEHGELPPNNWLSVFGGPAWERVPDGQYFLHLFTPEQPDLDWTNPEVVAEFQDVLRFWLDRGVDGFRIDVAHGLAKDPDLIDVQGDPTELLRGDRTGVHPHWDQDAVHEVYRGWRQVVDRYSGDRAFVAEAWVPNPERFAMYLRPDELHTAFNFDFLAAGWDGPKMRAAIDHTLTELAKVGAPATWVLSNHDVVRHVTRFGGGELGLARARAASLMALALPGGAYVYQGEELGLEEITDIPDELRQDPVFFQTGGERPGRDGCRVPLPWSGTQAPFGFGPSGTPWLPQPASWARVSVAAQDGVSGSTLELYRSALRLRRSQPALGDGVLSWVPGTPDGLLAFTRDPGFACVANITDQPLPLPAPLVAASALLASAPEALVDGRLAGNATVWLRADR